MKARKEIFADFIADMAVDEDPVDNPQRRASQEENNDQLVREEDCEEGRVENELEKTLEVARILEIQFAEEGDRGNLRVSGGNGEY